MGSPLSIVFLAFSLLGGAYLAAGLSLSAGTLEQPGAGFFPRMVAVFILGLSIPGWIGSLKPGIAEEKAAAVFPRGKDLRRVVSIALAALLFALLLQPAGYAICSAFLMAAVLRLLGMRGWAKTLLTAVLTAGGSYFFFSLLDIPLPRGILFS